jgi:2-polyprenyl-6-hydroxyphenyl methylase / 3-demethylubiquinone-9 3-methyltransferase
MVVDAVRNNLAIYDDVASRWWSEDLRSVRTLKNMAPGRLGYFDRFMAWPGAKVLDLGCAGGLMAEAMADRGAVVTGIDPAIEAIAAAKAYAAINQRIIR